MRRLSSLVFALFTLLLAPSVVRAQAVRDSVKITVFSTYDEYITEYGGSFGQPVYYVGTCHFQVLGMWPDVLGDQGLPRSYGVVRTAAGSTDGLQLTGLHSPPNASKFVPEGFQGIGSNLYGTSSWAVSDPYPNYAECSRRRGEFASWAAGAGEWYAVFSLPNGMPLALFDFDNDHGLRVDFDGSFESKQSREIDASAPGGKRPVASYAWDFGDGQTGSGAKPSHVYADTGRYTVTLTVTDDDGQTDDYTREVKVQKGGLLIWAELTPGSPTEYQKGDTVSVTTYVENVSDDIAFNVVVPNNAGLVSKFPESLTAGGRTYPTYKRIGPEGSTTTLGSLNPGQRREVVTTYRVDQYGIYRGPTYYQTSSTETFATITGVTGQDVLGKAVPVKEKCAPNEACGETWSVVPPVVRVTFQMRTVEGYGNRVRSGLTLREGAPEPSFYGNLGSSGSFDDATCVSGCVELIATAYDQYGVPVENADIRFTIQALTGEQVLTTYPRGGHVCSKLRSGQTAANPTCNPFTITVKTASDGQARAIYAVQAVRDAVSTSVEGAAISGNYVMAYETSDLTVEPNEVFAAEQTLTGYDSKFLLANRQLVNAGGQSNSIGDYCENSVKWLRNQTGVQDSYSLLKNSSVFATNVGTSWVCDKFLDRASQLSVASMKILDWLTGEGGVGATGDLMKKMGHVNLYLWTLGAYSVKNPHGLSSVSGPHPAPLVLQFDGDFYDWTADALGSLVGPITGGVTTPITARDLTGVRTRMRVFEASTMRMGANSTLSSSYLRAHAELDESGGAGWTNVSKTDAEYLYLPSLFLGQSRSEWLANLIGITGNPLGEGDTDATLDAPSPRAPLASDSLGAAPTATASAAVTWKAGDFVTIGDSLASELNQIATVEAAGGSSVRVTFVRPLAHAYAAGATVGFLAVGTAGAPLAPMIVPNLTDTARTELGWAPNPATLVETYDVQVSRDAAMTDRVHSEAATRQTRAAFDVSTLTEGQTYYWRVRAANRLGEGPWTAAMPFVARKGVGVASEGETVAATAVTLSAPYPNPSRGAATLRYQLPQATDVRLSVYDVLGREVAVAVNETRAAGRHEALVDVSAWSPGVYLVRLSAGETVTTQRLTVVH